MRTHTFFSVLLCLILISFSFSALAASGYSGYSGEEKNIANAPAPAIPPAAAPQQQPATQTPAPAVANNESEQKVTDPCASYMYAYDAYTLCHDRLVKIQRMKDAKGKRAAKREVKAPAATTTPAAAPAATPEGSSQAPAATDDATKKPEAAKIEEALKQAQ